MYKVKPEEQQPKTITAVKQLSSTGQFVYGGLSGMLAICMVYPMDVVKTRMQLSSMNQHRSSLQAFFNIAKLEGVSSLYSGLSAGLFRQATYTTAKLGVFNVMMNELTKKNEETGKDIPPSFMMKTFGGMVAGAVAAIVGTPAEVALIRMQSDGRLPMEQRRNYRNVFDALLRIYREEGLLTMWKGCSPTVGRAVVLNAAQLAVYSQAKQMIIEKTSMKDGIPVHLIASLSAGFAASFVSLPLDMAKTTLQAQQTTTTTAATTTATASTGTVVYKNSIDVLMKTVKNDGVLRLWRGFTPYFLKVGPHTVFTFLIFEQCRNMFGKVSGGGGGAAQ